MRWKLILFPYATLVTLVLTGPKKHIIFIEDIGIQPDQLLVLGHFYLAADFPLLRTSGSLTMLPQDDLVTWTYSNIHPDTFKHPLQKLLNIQTFVLKHDPQTFT